MNELETAENKLTPEMQTNPGRKPPRLKLPKTNKNKVILGIVVMGILSLIISFAAFRIGVSALKKSYKTTFEKEKEAAYNAQYEKYFKQVCPNHCLQIILRMPSQIRRATTGLFMV